MPEEREISTNYEVQSTFAALLFDKGSGAEVDVRCWAKNPCPASPIGADYSLAIRVRLTKQPRKCGMCESHHVPPAP